MGNGVLFAAPIPEKYHSVGETIQGAVEIAVQEAEGNGMSKRGKEVTPWILKRVGELSGGKSLPSSTPLCSCRSLTFAHHLPLDIALIENTSLIGTHRFTFPVTARNFLFPGGQIAASYAKLVAERAIEAGEKLVSNFCPNFNQV